MDRGFDFRLVIIFLLVTLLIIVLIILYKYLLNYFSKDRLKTEEYCVLYSLDSNFPKGEVEFYFTVPDDQIHVSFQILNEKWELHKELKSEVISKGGTIINFNLDELDKGLYYYGIVTPKQETFKKVYVN
jgi:hypothetical protein